MTEKEFNEKNSAILKASKEIRLQQNIYTDLQKTSDLMQRGQEVLETKDAKIEERGSLLGASLRSWVNSFVATPLKTGLDISLAAGNLIMGDEEFAKFMVGDYGVKKARDLTDAEIAYKQAIEYNDSENNPIIYYNIGCVLIKQNKFKEAIQYFDKTLELDSTFKSALNNKNIAMQLIEN